MSITLYHNPKCSKSRQTKALLEARDIDHEIILYLENPPTPEELAAILTKLNIKAEALIRKTEALYKTLGLHEQAASNEMLIEIMCNNPKLIERPIVVTETAAAIGRPPENILSIL